MKLKLAIAGLGLLCSFCARPQFYNFPSPASSALGLSGASDTTGWSAFSNPSGIAAGTELIAGGGYYNAFRVEALSARSAFVVIPASLVHSAAGYAHFGHELFNVRHFSVTLARQVSPRVRMGCRFEYALRSIHGRRARGAVIVDAGLRYSVSKAVMIAVMAENPARSAIGGEYNEQPLASSLAVSCDVRLSPSFLLTTDISHDALYSRQVFGLGLCVGVHEKITLRGAVCGKPVRFSLGAALRPGSFEITAGAGHHSRLGMSPAAGIIYFFGKEDREGGEQ
ncbi:MAG: hypothetical protein R6U46_09620 [Marinilabilia sp.]